MGKFAQNVILDGALGVIVSSTTAMCVCSGQPMNYAEASGGLLLALAEMGPADMSGPTVGINGGRRITVARKPELDGMMTGRADHLALIDGKGQRLLYVTECEPQGWLGGNTVTVPGWAIEMLQPE